MGNRNSWINFIKLSFISFLYIQDRLFLLWCLQWQRRYLDGIINTDGKLSADFTVDNCLYTFFFYYTMVYVFYSAASMMDFSFFSYRWVTYFYLESAVADKWSYDIGPLCASLTYVKGMIPKRYDLVHSWISLWIWTFLICNNYTV